MSPHSYPAQSSTSLSTIIQHRAIQVSPQSSRTELYTSPPCDPTRSYTRPLPPPKSSSTELYTSPHSNPAQSCTRLLHNNQAQSYTRLPTAIQHRAIHVSPQPSITELYKSHHSHPTQSYTRLPTVIQHRALRVSLQSAST